MRRARGVVVSVLIATLGLCAAMPGETPLNRAGRRMLDRRGREIRPVSGGASRVIFWPIGSTGVRCYDSFSRTGYIKTWTNPNGYHRAQDFSSRTNGTSIAGCRVYTPVNGTVKQNGWNSYWGWFFTILAPDGDIWLCAHLRYQCALRSGTVVTKRLLAGYVGCTGNCSGPHLHIEHWNGTRRDPDNAHIRWNTYPHYNSTFPQVA